jgi:hypothetical protein
MKTAFILLASIISLFYINKSNKVEKEFLQNSNAKEILKNTNITSINFTKSEIIGESHYGFRYEFDIRIDSSNNLDILNFCETNFSVIFNGRVDNIDVVNAILEGLNNNDNVRIDESPKGLRLLGTATELFDSVEVEIYLKEDKLLYLDLKYYSPL